MSDWKLPGTERDEQSVTSQWQVTGQTLIEGVRHQEVRSVPCDTRILTEIWRRDWELDSGAIDQIFQVRLEPGAVSAWHAHEVTTDRLFANSGYIKIVLYDARPDSPTHKVINEFRIGPERPGLIVVPPQVYHGVQNLGHESAILLNAVDHAYAYESPDHWRLPADTAEILYSFAG